MGLKILNDEELLQSANHVLNYSKDYEVDFFKLLYREIKRRNLVHAIVNFDEQHPYYMTVMS